MKIYNYLNQVHYGEKTIIYDVSSIDVFFGNIVTKQSVALFLKNIHIVDIGFNFYFFKRLNQRELSILHSKYEAIKNNEEEYQKIFSENFAFPKEI